MNESRLKSKRVERRLTQEDLAKISNISRVEISNIETGKVKNVKLETAINLANALGCSLQALFF